MGFGVYFSKKNLIITLGIAEALLCKIIILESAFYSL